MALCPRCGEENPGRFKHCEVVMGEGTYRSTRRALSAEPVEPLDLKGKAEPVPAYRLVSAPLAGLRARAVYAQGRYDEVDPFLRACEEAAAGDLVTASCGAPRARSCSPGGQAVEAQKRAREAVERAEQAELHAGA